MKQKIYLTLILLAFISCFKKEKPITLPEATSEISTHFMGDDIDPYSKQLYFDLSTNTFYENQLADWDICFSSGDSDEILINTGYGIRICKANWGHFYDGSCNDTDYINSRFNDFELFEGANGKAYTSIFKDWKSYKLPETGSGILNPGIYYIKLSYLSGSDRFRRLQIMNVDDSFFYCKFAKINEDYPALTKIYRDKSRNFIRYTFKNGGIALTNSEPSKDLWDFEFTQYKTFVPTLKDPYPVRGVFSNKNGVLVSIDFVSKFEEITDPYNANYVYSSDRDAIGYDKWKTLENPVSGPKYVVNPNITYIIKDTDGFYYKLRFLDFYDKLGRRGNPKFEYVRIK